MYYLQKTSSPWEVVPNLCVFATMNKKTTGIDSQFPTLSIHWQLFSRWPYFSTIFCCTSQLVTDEPLNMFCTDLFLAISKVDVTLLICVFNCLYPALGYRWISKVIRKRHESSVTSLAWHPNNVSLLLLPPLTYLRTSINAIINIG